MSTRARSGSHLAVSVYANTSAPSNTITVSSTGNLVTANDLSVTGTLVGYVTNAYLQATFAQNTAATALASDKLQVANAAVTYVTKATALTTNNALVNLTSDRLQVANAAVTYVTKATALTSNNAVVNLVNDRLQVANAAVTYVTKAVHLASNTAVTGLIDDRIQVANAAVTYVTKAGALTTNNAVINLIDDRLQVANAAVTYVTKSVALTSNNALVNLINDRLQVANLTSSLSTYWPSANAIAYINANAGATDMTVNTSIFVASGGETSFAVPITSNTNTVEVFLNGFGLTRSIDWTANSTHIKGIEALATGDILQVHEFKLHPANTLNRSAGGGGGYSFQGTSYGFAVQGIGDSPYASASNIERFSFTSDGNSTDVGDYFSTQRTYLSGGGNTSDTSGYTAGGNNSNPGSPGFSNVISKYPFAISGGTSTDAADLAEEYQGGAQQSSSTSGYYSGGTGLFPSSPYNRGCIQKWPFASDTNATNVATLSVARSSIGAGQSSSTNGYTSGGLAPSYSNVIDKFPFSSDTNATDVGDLSKARDYVSGQSSSENGYVSGGQPGSGDGPSPYTSNRVDKFPFSSDTSATDVLDLFEQNYHGVGHSSTTYGYVSGGRSLQIPGTNTNVIQKFPFSSDTNGTDVGDILASRYGGQGSQS